MARITIVGTGLIGTSLAMALRNANLPNLELVGTDSDGSVRRGAEKSHAFHRIEARLLPAINETDILVFATPVMAIKDLMEAIGSEIPPGCVVTDVGSTKKEVLEWADEYLPRTVDFVGGHPMAGKETPGPENADPELFRNRPYCIVPGINANQKAVSEISTMAEAIGAKPFFIGVDEHDSFVAAASHLPFLLSAALMSCTSKSANWEDIAKLASSGFNGVSRLASGDPVMHKDICVSNPEPIVAWIDTFIRELYGIRQALTHEEGPDGNAILQMFEQASVARAHWLAGTVPSRSQQANPELPSFSESMGEMFAGSKIMEAQRKMFRGGSSQEQDRERRRR